MGNTNNKGLYKFSSKVEKMSSQVFLFVHAIETIANKVFDRDCTV